jgi:hypothetical protein
MVCLCFVPLPCAVLPTAELYRQYELGTSDVSTLQEVTDYALDDINSRAADATECTTTDAETGGSGLTDWPRLLHRLEQRTLVERLAACSGRACGGLMQQQARMLGCL